MLTGTMGTPNFWARLKIPFLNSRTWPSRVREPFGESDQADAGIKGLLRTLGHDLEARTRRRVRDGHIPEAAHQPTVDRNSEMRLELEAPKELWNCRVDDKRIEDIYMIADKNTGPLRIEAGRPPNFQPYSRQPQDIPKECALRPVVLPRVYEDSKKQ